MINLTGSRSATNYSFIIIRWRDAKVLIIDEISMIAGELFDIVDKRVQQIRGSDHPFGGVQIIACGVSLQIN